MQRRWLLAGLFAVIAVLAAVGQLLWIALLDEATSDLVAWGMSLLGAAVVPLALAAAGAMLLGRDRARWRWPLVGSAGLASIAVAAGTGAFLTADALPPDPRLAGAAMNVALAAVAVLAALLTVVVFRLPAGGMPGPARSVLAVAAGVVGSVTLVALIAARLPLCVAAVVLLIAVPVAIRRAAAVTSSWEPEP